MQSCTIVAPHRLTFLYNTALRKDYSIVSTLSFEWLILSQIKEIEFSEAIVFQKRMAWSCYFSWNAPKFQFAVKRCFEIFCCLFWITQNNDKPVRLSSSCGNNKGVNGELQQVEERRNLTLLHKNGWWKNVVKDVLIIATRPCVDDGKIAFYPRTHIWSQASSTIQLPTCRKYSLDVLQCCIRNAFN